MAAPTPSKTWIDQKARLMGKAVDLASNFSANEKALSGSKSVEAPMSEGKILIVVPKTSEASNA